MGNESENTRNVSFFLSEQFSRFSSFKNFPLISESIFLILVKHCKNIKKAESGITYFDLNLFSV